MMSQHHMYKADAVLICFCLLISGTFVIFFGEKVWSFINFIIYLFIYLCFGVFRF